MTIHRRVAGEVQYNDGQFAEIQMVGAEGIEKDLLMDSIQIHRESTGLTPEQFQHRFPAGIWLDIHTTIEVSSRTKGNH